eukprot:403360732
MGNALCSEGGTSTGISSSPVSFMEYEYFKPIQEQKENLLQKKKRMDIMASAMNQAMFDIKYYMGMLDDQSDDDLNESESIDINKLKNKYMMQQRRKGSDESASSAFMRRGEDLYKEYIRQKKREARMKKQQENSMRKQKFQAISKFKKKSFIEGNEQSGTTTGEVSYSTPRNMYNKTPKNMFQPITFLGATNKNTKSKIQLRDPRGFQNGLEAIFDHQTGPQQPNMKNSIHTEDGYSDDSYLTIKHQDQSDIASSKNFGSSQYSQQSDNTLVIKRVKNSSSSSQSSRSHINMSSSNMSSSQYSNYTTQIRKVKQSHSNSRLLLNMSQSSFNNSQSFLDLDESEIIRKDFEEELEQSSFGGKGSSKQIYFDINEAQISPSLDKFRMSFGVKKPSKSQFGSDDELNQLDDEVRFSQNFEALKKNMMGDQQSSAQDNQPLSDRRHRKNKFSGDLDFNQENSNPNQFIRKSTLTKKLNADIYIKKEYQIEEQDEHANYLSESSFSTPFKNRFKSKNKLAHDTSKNIINKDTDSKTGNSKHPQQKSLNDSSVNQNFPESDSDDGSVRFLEVSFEDLEVPPLVQSRESFGIMQPKETARFQNSKVPPIQIRMLSQNQPDSSDGNKVKTSQNQIKEYSFDSVNHSFEQIIQ